MKTLIYSLSLGFALLMLSSTIPSTSGYSVGDTATDFNLMSTTGDMVSMEDYARCSGICNHLYM